MMYLIAMVLFSVTFSTSAVAQQLDLTPKSLPQVTLDCYQAFSTIVGLPENSFREIAIDGDNFDVPTIRYRLAVANQYTLKIIERPNDAALRKEFGKNITAMTRDFTNKHRIVGWRDDTASGLKLYTVDFDNRLFSIVDIRNKGAAIPAAVTVNVHTCK